MIMEVMKSKALISPVTNVLREYKFYDYHKNYSSVGATGLVRDIKNVYALQKEGVKIHFTHSFLEECVKIIREYNNFIENKELLQKYNQKNVNEWWDKDIQCPIPLFSHQKVGIMQLLTMNTFGLLWDPGTGKTAAVAVALEQKIARGSIDRAFIFCPMSIRLQWVEEIKAFTNGLLKPLVVNTANIDEIFKYDKYNTFLLTYESILNHVKKFMKVVDDRTHLVLDESTKIKNSCQRTKKFLRLSRLTRHKTIMTGTIASERLSDAFYQIKFLDSGERLGATKESFLKKYTYSYDRRVLPKTGAIEEVSDLIFNISSRFRRDEVIDIPPCMRRIVHVEMTEKQLLLYKSICNQILTNIKLSGANEASVNVPIMLVQLLRCRQVTSGFVGAEVENEREELEKVEIETDNPKLEVLDELCSESYASNIPTIIWCTFRYEIKKICEMLDSYSYAFDYIEGSVKEADREIICTNFMKKKINFLVANTKTLEYGKNLQIGQRVIYFSTPWSYTSRKQSEDRVFRPGQKNKVEIIDIICKNSIDVRVHQTLSGKKELSRMINKDNIERVMRGE